MTPTATPLALRLFTDRDEPREVLRRFFQRIKDGASGGSEDARPILSFYGVGGVGKSTLLAKALDDFGAAEEADLHELEQRRLRAAVVDLDVGTVTPDIGIERVMVRVRNRINAQGVSTPHFDYLYALWVSEEQPEQGIRLPSDLSAKGSKLEDQLSAWDAVSNIASFLGEALPGADSVRAGLAGLKRLHAWVERSRMRSRFVNGLPIGWPQRLRLERMPALLALDLLGSIAHQPQLALCLAVDGFERIQSRHHAQDAQWAFQSLVAEVLACVDTLPAPDGRPLKGRIGFVFLGRERLRWAELYGREAIRIPWARVIEEHLELCGLAEGDARDFLLHKVVPHEQAEGRVRVAELIAQHADALLAAAGEHLPGAAPSYLPYYLDLGVALVRNNAAFFDPADLGTTPAELQARFLRSLPPAHRAAFRALALALEFDADTFAFLLDEGHLTGFTGHDFNALVGDDWSFVNPQPGVPGTYRFHRHMQAALLADQAGRAEDRSKAAAVFRALLARQTARVAFATPADCGPAQLAAFDLAAAQLRDVAAYHSAPALLPATEIVSAALVLNARFDWHHFSEHRRPLLHWLVGLAKAELGVEHPDTLRAMNDLAETLRAQDNLTAARALHEQALAVHRQVLGEEHAGTLTLMNNLATTLWAQGDLAGARALEEQALAVRRRVQGEEHADTLTSMNNLAATLGAQGDLAGARALHEQVLAVCRRVLGEEHADTLTSINNLAETLRAQGDLAGARALHEPALAVLRRVLGEEHPNTVRSMNNLAETLREQGDPAGALALHEQALAVSRRVLGEEHPDTLRAMNNLAETLQAQGDLAGARALQEPVLAVCRWVQGEEHPDTSISAWNLFATLQALRDAKAAQAVLTKDLAWLVARDPATLGADQRRIRGYVLQKLGLDPDPAASP